MCNRAISNGREYYNNVKDNSAERNKDILKIIGFLSYCMTKQSDIILSP